MPAASPLHPAKLDTISRRAALALVTAFTAAACARLEFLAANAPTLFGAYQRHADLRYGAHPRQRADVYVPDKTSGGPRPLVVFWHGGRWESGDKKDYRFVGAALAELGFVAVVSDYRLYPEVKLAGFMQDAALAVSWAVAHAQQFHANPAKLFLMGHSSGAHMAALVAMDPRYYWEVGVTPPHVAGVIGLSGPYDFLPFKEQDLQDMFGPPERYALSQPINFVSAKAPPMLLVHGERDRIVAPFNARHLAAALQAQGVAVTLHMYPTLDHADTVAALSEPARHRAPILGEIGAFVGL
jgi:acetyl esterase/lipase